MSRPLVAVILALLAITACDGLRHPLDDSETRPVSQEEALDEADAILDLLGASVMGDASYVSDTWLAPGGCATAPFGPSQGEVGSVLLRTYTDSPDTRSEDLIEAYEEFWTEQGESVSRSSPDMEPGAVSRVNGIGYELVVPTQGAVLRAYTPCY